MRLGTVIAFALVGTLLTACSDEKAPTKPAEAPAATAPAAAPKPATKAPAAPAAVQVPAGAAPLIGTWAAALENCGDANSAVVITANKFTSSARSCDIALKPTNDGSFTTACGSDQLKLTPVFAPTGEGVNVFIGDGKRQTILRCTR